MMYGRGLLFGRGFGGHMYYGHGLFGPYIIGLITLFVLAVIIVLIIRAARRNTRIKGHALETLRLEFAKGTFTEKEFLSRKAVLEESNKPAKKEQKKK